MTLPDRDKSEDEYDNAEDDGADSVGLPLFLRRLASFGDGSMRGAGALGKW